MKLLLFLMTIVDVSLQVCFRTKALAARGVRALVVFAMISLVMSVCY